MLVLHRSNQDNVKMFVQGTNIEIDVKVLGFRRGQVMLGFNAPQNVIIRREDRAGKLISPEDQQEEAINRIKHG